MAAFTSIVNNNIVSFTNNSKYANTWSWDFGDGTTSVENNPTHTYNPGNYLAKLITQNKCGVDTSFETIVIGSGLTVGFSVNQTKGCIPFSVQYSNNSAGATAYSWSFPGGNPSTSTDLNPVVTYNTVGIYDATLIASNASDSKSITKLHLLKLEIFQNLILKLQLQVLLFILRTNQFMEIPIFGTLVIIQQAQKHHRFICIMEKVNIKFV